ncbi:MAG: hypothetical protein J0L94_00750 [Rhodothermia bacterium]|nr:hypothetical protein [Rhodothermia bacterium]
MIGEVIASESKSFKAQVVSSNRVPAFGEWVEVRLEDGSLVLGVVYSVLHESIEPGRQVEALRRTKDELALEMPHVFELLRTVFSCLIVGYRTSGGVYRQTIPPNPPALHDFVFVTGQELLKEVKPPYDFFRLILGGGTNGLPTDDLFVTIFQKMSNAMPLDRDRMVVLVEAGRALSRLLGDDHERLQSILRRVSS